MPAPRRVALIALLLALLVGLAWRGASDDSGQAAEPSQPLPPATVAAGTDDITRPATSVPGPTTVVATLGETALPPELAGLVARAEAGDTRAACELGTRLVACAYSIPFTEESLASFRREERDAEARGDHVAANKAASLLLSGTLAIAACTDLTPALRKRSFEFIRQAALGGEPDAIVRYATGQALVVDGMAPFAFLRLPHFDTWRSEAPALLEGLEQSGDPQAVLALVVAANEGNHYGLIMPPDPVRDAALHLLSRRMFGEHPTLANLRMPRITADQRRQAEALAQSWHSSRFEGRSFRLEDHTGGLYQPLLQHFEDSWPKPSGAASSCFTIDTGDPP